MSSSVIVLNFDYSYLNMINWKRAVCFVVTDKAEILKANENEIISNATKSVTIPRPLVIRLLNMVKGMFSKKVPFTYKNVFIRDNYKCQYCGSTEDLTIDHIIPRSKGGKSNFENCVTACRLCNNYKGNKSLSELGMGLARVPKTPAVIEFLDYKLKNSDVYTTLKRFWSDN